MPKRPLLAAAALLASITPLHAADPPQRPNVVLILADDMGYSDLGCYGGEISTPSLDKLAAGGLRFTRFYNCTRCCPSRASLLSGLYPHQAGVGLMTGDQKLPGYRGQLQPNAVTIAEVLKAAGYRTLMCGKWHLAAGPKKSPTPVDRGFDDYFGLVEGFRDFWDPKAYVRLPAGRPARTYPPGGFYATDAFADHALDFLADARKTPDKPFFLYLAFTAPHFPLHAPAEDVAKYKETYAKGWDKLREERLARMKKLGLVGPDTRLPPRSEYETLGYKDRGTNPAWDSLPADRRADLARRMAVYAAMIDRMDRHVGRVIDDLRKHDQLDNTLVLVLSDNGACAEWDPFGFDGSSGPNNVLHRGADLDKMGGPGTYHSYGSGWANACNTPFRLYKHYCHEGGISTPLIAHWPKGIAATGELRDQVGHIIDVMATCLDVTGATYPAGKTPPEGKSLVPAFAGKPLDRDHLAWEHEGNRAIRAGKWKLVARRDGPWELYDIDADRTEQTDLAAGHPDRVRELSGKWDKWAKRTNVLPRPTPKKKG
jgi:arylsulfatase A-like enzyme